MIIQLGVCNDEKEVVNKTFTVKYEINAVLKDNVSIINPVFVINTPNDLVINYIFVPQFNRYYYVTEITTETGGRYSISCHCDVLNSFKEDIKKCRAIIEKQETNTYSSKYIDDGSYVMQCKDSVQSYNFPYGFTNNANILITAGG